MRPASRAPVLVLLLLAASLPAGAQGLPSGSIAGSVKTEAGAQPLPGVEVSVRSPALQGERRTASARNGDFLLAALPPGEYSVDFRLKGFRAVSKTGVRVGASQREELRVAMGLEAASEEVVVAAASDLASADPQAATTIGFHLLDELPVPRTIESAVLLAPDVYARPVNSTNTGATDAFSIAGAETYENLFTIDGVSPQENLFRSPEPLYVEDAVAEVTTLTSGISAEHGYFVGGVVNVVTRTGGNDLSGSARSTLEDDAWSARTPAGEARVSDVTPIWEATLGGPLLRDRLWAFAAGRLLDQTTISSTVAPTSLGFPTDRKETRYQLKLTATPLASHTVTVGMTASRQDTHDTYYAGLPILDLKSTFDTELEQQILTAAYTGTVSDVLVLEAHYGRRRRTLLGGSADSDLVTGTPLLYPTPWIGYHAPFFCAVCPDPVDHRSSDQGALEATWFAPTSSLGSHTVVGGVEAYDGSLSVNNYQSGTGYVVFGTDFVVGDEVYPVFGPGTQLWAMPVLVPAAPNHIRTYSAFVNDTWRLSDRLSFNVGLRWDKNHARDPVGTPISDAGAFSPRLGAAWDATGKGTLRLLASWGRYVSILNETQIWGNSPYGINDIFVYLYDGPPVNTDPGQPLVRGDDALRQLFRWFGITATGQFPRPGIDPVAVYYPGVNVQLRSGLEAQRADEVTLGVSGSIGSRATWRIEAAERRFGRFYDVKRDSTTGTTTDPSGNVYDLGILTNTDGPYERRHRALKAGAQVRLGSTFTAGGTWTWSRTSGNHVGESLGGGPQPASALTYPEYWQRSWHLPTGDLPQDVRHRLRLWATWDVPSLPRGLGTLSVSPLFALDTGQPYGAPGDVLIGDYVTNPGYVTPPYTETYWFTGRDAFRTPTVTHVDLALHWSRRLGGFETFVQPQVINLFNERAIATNEPSLVDQGVTTAAYDSSLLPFDPFRERPVEGVHYRKSPTFGRALAPQAYQQPRTFRVSLGVRF